LTILLRLVTIANGITRMSKASCAVRHFDRQRIIGWHHISLTHRRVQPTSVDVTGARNAHRTQGARVGPSGGHVRRRSKVAEGIETVKSDTSSLIGHILPKMTRWI
jgi:hypothetical protein